jgi:hypothetical protein
MAKVNITTVKNWFKTGLKPNQAQFWDLFDSYWHKDDKIPVGSIEDIDKILLDKADKGTLTNHNISPDAHENIMLSKEDAINKSLSFITDLDSDLKYPSVKSVYDWVVTNVQGVPFLGSVTPTTTPAGTGKATWFAAQAGTYTNFGALVVNANSLAVISRDDLGAFSISQTAFALPKDTFDDTNNVDASTMKATGGYVKGREGGLVASGDTKNVSGDTVFNYTKNFIGDLLQGGVYSDHRNLLNDVITDIKITGQNDYKVYMLGSIAFNDATFKDYTKFYEGTIVGGVFVNDRTLTAFPSGSENVKIPTTLEGIVTVSYQLPDGINIKMTFDFDKIAGWTTSLFNISGSAAYVANGAYINPKKIVNYQSSIIRNYQGNNFSGDFQYSSSYANAQNLLTDVIVDLKITGSDKDDIYQINGFAFKHATLKDYFKIRKGYFDDATGLPVWTSSDILYSGAFHPDYPDTPTGKVKASYIIFNDTVLEIWFDFDKAIFSEGAFISVSAQTYDYGYKSYMNTLKQINIKDYVKRNTYQGSLYGGVFQSATSDAKNLLNDVIEDFRIMGAEDVDIYKISYFCFNNTSLKDYIRFYKGHIDTGTDLPVWDSSQVLFSGVKNPDYPATLTGKVRVKYVLSQNVDIEIWFDFDKATFADGANISVGQDTWDYAYNTWIAKTKMIPQNRSIPTASYPTFADKKILIFGDSITDQKANTSWVDFAIPALGGSTYVNYADGGAGFIQNNVVGIDDMPTQLTNANAQTGVDAVIVALGTNDWHGQVDDPTLGSYDLTMAKAIGSLDVENIMYDAIRFAFYTIQNNWDCKCYVVLPIQRASYNYQRIDELYLALTELAIGYGFEIIDGRKSGIVFDFEASGAEGRDLIDGLHPKDDEAKGKLAKIVVSSLRNTFTDI